VTNDATRRHSVHAALTTGVKTADTRAELLTVQQQHSDWTRVQMVGELAGFFTKEGAGRMTKADALARIDAAQIAGADPDDFANWQLNLRAAVLGAVGESRHAGRTLSGGLGPPIKMLQPDSTWPKALAERG